MGTRMLFFCAGAARMSAALVRKCMEANMLVYTAPTLSRGRYVFTSIDRFTSHGSSHTECPAPRESVDSLYPVILIVISHPGRRQTFVLN